METVAIKTTTHPYMVYIDTGIRHSLGEYVKNNYSSIFIITDDRVAPHYLDDCLKALADEKHVHHSIITHGEQSKCMETYYHLQTEALSIGLDRSSLIIALGGGVVGDLAGFVAATFMRGIDYIQMPTTILAHDSSVGGKVAINHEQGKNLIGSFYPPKAVIYDTDTLTSLDNREVRSGYAELIKEAFIRDREMLTNILQTNIFNVTNEQLVWHLKRGIQIKATIVENDEREHGERKFLNLGHTLAHALEAELGYGSITHGEAVAIGILFALHTSKTYFQATLPYQPFLQWLRSNHYPLNLPKLDIYRLIDRMKSDKKTIDGQIQVILLKDIGEPITMDIPDQDLFQILTSFVKELGE